MEVTRFCMHCNLRCKQSFLPLCFYFIISHYEVMCSVSQKECPFMLNNADCCFITEQFRFYTIQSDKQGSWYNFQLSKIALMYRVVYFR